MSSSDATTARDGPERILLSPPGPDPDGSATVAYTGEAAPATAGSVVRQFGPYALLQELGRGGMGVVFKAHHASLDRVVALKMILPGSLPTADDLQRFRTEAAAAARLQHPNIVSVHDVGAIDGQHYYCMDYIEGPSLTQRLVEGPLACRDAARLVCQIARAIQHAHHHQILHRDLKPSNILLDAEEQPHVTDFGLAKKLGSDSGQTRTGAILGTPSYMSPEQAAGRTKELGPTCDVYGLGAVLYELLTGRPPFRSDTPLDTMMHVLDSEPAPPRLLNPKVERDLETICLKCLEKDPKHRYASAAALAEDLTRYLEREPISARSFNMLDRLTRTLDRSQFDVEFRTWGTLLLCFAPIVLVEHLVIFFLTRGEPPYPHGWILLIRFVQFGIMGVLFWRFRSRRVLPASAAERQLWSIWLGYLVACSVGVGAERAITGAAFNELTLFPIWAVLSGMAFFVMGSNYWGRCYAYGAAFFALALLMPLRLRWAGIEFGLLWTMCLVDLGLRLRRLGRQDQPSSLSQQSSGPAAPPVDHLP